MTMKNVRECRRCDAFEPHQSGTSSFGFCRFDPPKKASNHNATWPTVAPTDWCMKFSRAEGHNDRRVSMTNAEREAERAAHEAEQAANENALRVSLKRKEYEGEFKSFAEIVEFLAKNGFTFDVSGMWINADMSQSFTLAFLGDIDAFNRYYADNPGFFKGMTR